VIISWAGAPAFHNYVLLHFSILKKEIEVVPGQAGLASFAVSVFLTAKDAKFFFAKDAKDIRGLVNLRLKDGGVCSASRHSWSRPTSAVKTPGGQEKMC